MFFTTTTCGAFWSSESIAAIASGRAAAIYTPWPTVYASCTAFLACEPSRLPSNIQKGHEEATVQDTRGHYMIARAPFFRTLRLKTPGPGPIGTSSELNGLEDKLSCSSLNSWT